MNRGRLSFQQDVPRKQIFMVLLRCMLGKTSELEDYQGARKLSALTLQSTDMFSIQRSLIIDGRSS